MLGGGQIGLLKEGCSPEERIGNKTLKAVKTKLDMWKIGENRVLKANITASNGMAEEIHMVRFGDYTPSP